MLAHELGSAVWCRAKSETISDQAVIDGIIDAGEIIGRKLLEPQIFDAIRSKKYRSILSKITSKKLTRRFDRSGISRNLTPEETRVLDNFLQRMKRLGVLTPDPDVRGGYLFPNLLHALYFSTLIPEPERCQQPDAGIGRSPGPAFPPASCRQALAPTDGGRYTSAMSSSCMCHEALAASSSC